MASQTHLADAAGAGLTTLAVNPTSIGDCVLVAVTVDLVAGLDVSSLTHSGFVNGFTRFYYDASTDVGYGSFPLLTTMWLGVVSATGSATLTVAFSGTLGAHGVEICAWEFSDGQSRDWRCVAINPVPGRQMTAATTAQYSRVDAPMGGGSVFAFANVSCDGGITAATNGSYTQTANTNASGTGTLTGLPALGERVSPSTSFATSSGTSTTHLVLIQAFDQSLNGGKYPESRSAVIGGSYSGEGFMGTSDGPQSPQQSNISRVALQRAGSW